MVDRRPAVGGHWLDAYPFVRLHIPSAYYGVNSLPLGEDRIDEAGENAGLLRTGDRRGGPRALRRGGRAPDARRAGSASSPGTSTSAREPTASRSATWPPARCTRSRSGARSSTRGTWRRRCRPRTRRRSRSSPDARFVPVNELPAAAGSASSVHAARVGQDGRRRLHLAAGQRRGAGPDPVDPAAGRLVPRSRALPAARAGRRDHRGPLPRRRGGCPGHRRRRPLRAARGLGAALPHRPVAARRRCTAARC